MKNVGWIVSVVDVKPSDVINDFERFYAMRMTQVVSSPETQAPQNASHAHFVNSQTKRQHNKFPIFAFIHIFLTEIPKGVV